MRVTILAVGSRGDVQPYVALGRGLRAAGHAVCIATTRDFEAFVTAHGLAYAPIEGDFRALMGGETGQAWLESARNPARFVRQAWRTVRPLMESLFDGAWDACRGADAVICPILGLAGYPIADELGIPCYEAQLQPLHRTRAFPSPGFPDLRWGAYNRLTHVFVEQALWHTFRPFARRWQRRALKTRPTVAMRKPRRPVLLGYSPTVVPRPPDWGDHVHVTGYWFLDPPADWQPPADLLDFLEAGPPPVYIGFGSMSSRNAERMTGVVVEALKRAGQRGILLPGWGGLSRSDLPGDVLVIEPIPFSWLFPRMAAVVHHGGAGTTAAGLRAGVPSLVVPFIADQYFWGRRVADLGVGPEPIPRRKLSAGRLAEAISAAVTDGAMRRRAAVLGERIRAEDGVARAVEVLEGGWRGG